MTVNSISITNGPYAGDGITTDFTYGFNCDEIAEIAVYETDPLGVTTLLTPTTDYTASGLGTKAGGGLVTRVAGALPSGYSWYIRSNFAETQLTAFASQGGFLPEIHEYTFDHLTYLVQQLIDKQKRSAALALFDPAVGTTDMTLPSPVASFLIGWNSAGTGLTLYEQASALGSLGASINAAPDKAAAVAADKLGLSDSAAGFGSASITLAELSTRILFAQGGVGAVTRFLQDKVREIVSVTDYGAVGDWTGSAGTDNTALFQAAIDALPASGGVLYVPGGASNQYYFATQAGPANPTLILPSNVHVIMDDDVYLLTEGGVASGVNGYNQTGSLQKALFVNSDPAAGNTNISITGGNIKSIAASAVGSALISLQNVKNVRITDINLLDTWGACRLQFSYCTNVMVNNVLVDYENIHVSPYSFEDGIRVGTGCYGVTISNSIINSGDDSIAISNEASETQNTLVSTSPFAYNVAGSSIRHVTISNVVMTSQAGNAFRAYIGPGMTLGSISDVTVENLSATPNHPSTSWNTAVSLYDNSGSSTNRISGITLSNFAIECGGLGSSGTGSPSAISVLTTGGNIHLSSGTLKNVSVPYGINTNYNTTVDNVEVTGCGNEAIIVSAADCVLQNNYINGAAAAGIRLFTGSANTIVMGNRIISTGPGIQEDTGAVNTTAIGNDVTGSAAVVVAPAGSGSVFENNMGYNPVGSSSISVGASPFTYTAGSTKTSVTVGGGTVTNITQAGVAMGLTNGTFELDPGVSLIVTYTAAPTMVQHIH